MGIFPEDYPGLNRLYEFAKETGVSEMGSSSIDPKFAESCTEIRKLMSMTCFIRQINEGANDLWAAMGDKSAILYLGGRKVDGREVGAAEYLEHLALVFGGLSEKAINDLEQIALSMYEMAHALPAGPVFSFTKGATFIIPPEAYKRNMTEEELEPFRVEKDDPRLQKF